ncbi:disease resistance protein At4g27190-like isoform X2 [Castanea sativa]|uniref:disease resistance protein At4g27190-like isoform X2 n=1 Tax=Castanea sativa TaxID=21020 RepID=UPI003F6545CE
MEVVAAAVGALVTSTGELLCSCVCSKINITVNLQSNLVALEKEMKCLMDRRKEVKHETEIAEKVGNEIRAQVVTWLEDAEKLQLRVNPIQEEMVYNENTSACFLNCSKRYKASKEVEEILQEIKRLLDVGSFSSGVAYSTRVPRAVEHIPGPSIKSQKTASRKFDETMSALYDNRFQRIGIWGLGGIGKTTLVKNLNNELKTASTQPFGIVIWATVSKNLDIKNVQIQIAQRLNLKLKMVDNMQRMANQLYQRLEKEERFLLILDDVWEKIDLNILGVPQPEVHKGCKILLTSRRMEVCRSMMTDIEVKMEVLNDEEAWQLFSQNAGDVAHLKDIKPYAEAIARECCGLPLAIIILGAAMRRKTKIELWDHALKELQRSMPSVGGIEDEVYKPLKWSYDSLQGNNIKECFLYCSLFPEDFSIEVSELVQHWLAEGLIDEQQNYVDSVNKGIALIENLKDSCLLEDGTNAESVKMHDVVRDVAIWITSSFEDGHKSFVRSGTGLSKISVGEFSNSFKRVSFMCNKITRLPDCVIQCSEASTLLLQGNWLLETVPERFLQGFEVLRVLNLGETCIKSLPLSLLQLSDLRALILRSCFSLEELPPLGGLSRLQILDLTATRIREIPRGMEDLSNLRQLGLSHTRRLKTIQTGIISRLSCLEFLDTTRSKFRFRMKGEEQDGQATFDELRYLDRLLILSITFKRIPCFRFEDLSWINRLRGFKIFMGTTVYPIVTTYDKRVIISGLDLSQESIGQLWGIANYLVLENCSGLNKMLKDLVINSVGCFVGLKSLTVERSTSSNLRTVGECSAHSDLLPNLEQLHLYALADLESISDLASLLGLRFDRLILIEVRDCYNMRCLLSCGDFICTLPNLEVIKILELKDLPELKTLCRHKETWPCLEQVDVIVCHRLRRLPLTEQNVGAIKEIRGESQWWDALEWDEDKTKSSLLPYFRPC